jgi:hypothetical protein
MKLQLMLEGLNFCDKAIEWVGDRGPKEAWLDCPNGRWMDWIFWYAASMSESEIYQEEVYIATTRKVSLRYERMLFGCDCEAAMSYILLQYAEEMRELHTWQEAYEVLKETFHNGGKKQ